MTISTKLATSALAAAGLCLAAVGVSTSAAAVDCAFYARTAVAQAREYQLKNCSGGPPHYWNLSYSVHYTWCLKRVKGKAGGPRPTQGTRIRANILHRCRVALGGGGSGQSGSAFHLPRFNGLMVDYCAEIKVFGRRRYRNGCGRDAAHWFCRRKGYGRAKFWDIDTRARPYNTIHMKTFQRCRFSPSNAVQRCRGFRLIRCG